MREKYFRVTGLQGALKNKEPLLRLFFLARFFTGTFENYTMRFAWENYAYQSGDHFWSTRLELVSGFEPLLFHHVGELIVSVLRKIDAFLFFTILAKNNKIWVVALDPLHLNIFILIMTLLLPQPATNLMVLI